jgi:hypothetical protein
MKLLLTEWYKDWRGEQPQRLTPAKLSLDDQKTLFALVVSLGNGDYDEVCIETDSVQAKACIIGLLQGTGNARPIEPTPAAEQRRLYRAGYEVYLQGESSYFFVNPIPRPELFQQADLKAYLAESKQS